MKKLIITIILILSVTGICTAGEITFLNVKLGKTIEKQNPEIEFGEVSTHKTWKFPYSFVNKGLPEIDIWYKLVYIEVIDNKIERLHIALPWFDTGKLSRAITKKYGKPKVTRLYGTTYGGAHIGIDIETWKLKNGQITMKERSSAELDTGYLDVETNKYLRAVKEQNKDKEKKMDKVL